MSNEASQAPPCILLDAHEVNWRLYWRNQGNGYNYYYCQGCDYIRFDFETGKIAEMLDAKDRRLKRAEEALKKISAMTDQYDDCRDIGLVAEEALASSKPSEGGGA